MMPEPEANHKSDGTVEAPLSALKDLAEAYIKDMAAISEKLETLQLSSNLKGAKKTLRQLRILLEKDSVQEIWNTVQLYAPLFNSVLLQLLQCGSSDAFGMKESKMKILEMQDQVLRRSESMNSMSGSLDSQLKLLCQKLDDNLQLPKRQFDLLASKIDLLQTQLAGLSMEKASQGPDLLIASNVLSASNSTNSLLDQLPTPGSEASFSSFEGDISSSATSPSVLESKHSASLDFVSSATQTAPQLRPIAPDTENRDCEGLQPLIENTFMATMARLYNLIDEDDMLTEGEKAEEILADLDCLLAIVAQSLTQPAPQLQRNLDSGQIQNALWKPSTELAISKVQSLLEIIPAVAINPRPFPAKFATTVPNLIVKRDFAQYTLAEGRLRIYTRMRGLKIDNIRHGQGKRKPRRATYEFIAKLLFTTTDNLSNARVLLSFYQFWTSCGLNSLPPMITVFRTIGFFSEAFHSVKCGDLGGLKRLLEERKATVRDCEPDGRSLLGVACLIRNPAICKYLIDHGADFDAFEVDHETHKDSNNFPILNLLWSAGCQDDADHSNVEECQRVLFNAGADPAPNAEPLRSCLANGSTNQLKTFFQFDCDLIDLEERHPTTGDTVLLSCITQGNCGVDDPLQLLQKIRILINAGADATATNNDGNTCLHLFLQRRCTSARALRHENKDILTFLVHSGANIHARNHRDQTATDVALQNRDGACGTYPAALWKAVMAQFGHDVPHSEEDSVFTNVYSLSNFNALFDSTRWKQCTCERWILDPVIHSDDEKLVRETFIGKIATFIFPFHQKRRPTSKYQDLFNKLTVLLEPLSSAALKVGYVSYRISHAECSPEKFETELETDLAKCECGMIAFLKAEESNISFLIGAMTDLAPDGPIGELQLWMSNLRSGTEAEEPSNTEVNPILESYEVLSTSTDSVLASSEVQESTSLIVKSSAAVVESSEIEEIEIIFY